MKTFRCFALISIFLTLLSACQTPALWGAPPLPPVSAPLIITPNIISSPAPTLSPTIESARVLPLLWISPAIPDALRQAAQGWGVPLASNTSEATMTLDVENSKIVNQKSTWIYALVAPFPTVMDDVSAADLKSAWSGSSFGPFGGSPLMLAESTLAALTSVWGAPASGAVRIVPEDQLLDAAWSELPAWAIIPFESIQPRWKVLSVDGQSPIHKDFDASAYPLAVNFNLSGSVDPPQVDLPATNRDPSKMTTLMMTGVTALVRATAVVMNTQGVKFPGKDIREMMLEADITHISNEVPFYSGCPQPDPLQENMVFCSATRYMELLTDIGTDVVELTGNHFADFGPDAMRETLAIYKQNNIPYYGGGADLADSLKPLLLENHGNKIAFMGCNQPDVGSFPTATDARPGAAPCDFKYMSEKIKELSAQGYRVIATFQWSEGPQPLPYPEQVQEFQHMADSGAVIVSGSQAHVPQVMEFRADAFIHYGLGNLFFDQMEAVGGSKIKRREFIDRHVFYDGRYLGVELITTYLEDFSRPRFMTLAERQSFLADYFKMSGWKTSP